MVLMVEQIWMQILIRRIYSKTLGQNKKFLVRGFTYIEILIVLTLVLIIVGSVTPNFLKIFSKPYESEYKHLSSLVKILRNDAILKNNSYCIIFDLKKQQIMTSKEDISGECEDNYFTKPKILEPHFFSEDLIMQEARLADKNYVSTKAHSDYLKIHINGSGFVTPFLLKFSLSDYTKSWKIESIGIMGELELQEL